MLFDERFFAGHVQVILYRISSNGEEETKGVEEELEDEADADSTLVCQRTVFR